MTNGMNRRGFLKTAGASAAALMASPLLQWASAAEGKTRKILFFTRSAGFQHSAITRDKKTPGKLSFAEQWLTDFGKENNFDVTCTKNGSIFTEEGLAPFDLIMFYTTGILDGQAEGRSPDEVNQHPMPPGGKEAFLNAIHNGKGFLGVHSATDTFHSPDKSKVDPYGKMIGGEFLIHHNQQPAKIVAVDENWGSIKGLKTFTKRDEWYKQKNVAPDLHVLLWQDTSTMDKDYKSFDPYPETWARMHGKGRVFYSSMGHREDVWQSPEFKMVLLGGLNWASGNVDAEVKPNVKEVTPKALFRPEGD